MKQELLCTWLGLPKACWPPDPWTLVGVPREEHDLGLIEQRVQDCMSKLRSYQLSYPEEATEGMNRLAEAFITLAEASSKVAPAAPPMASKQVPPVAVISKDETSVNVHTRVDWKAEPPPVRVEAVDEPDEPTLEEEAEETEVLIAKPFVAPAKPHKREIEAAVLRHLGQESDEATSNVGTIDAVIERVEATRRLLHAWDRVGKLLKCNGKKAGPKETEAFAKRLGEIAKMMEHYPAFLGQPGKPGYRVVVLARLKMPLASARGVNDEQREELLFDWDSGRRVLLEHRKYLRRHFKSMRRRSTVGLAVHAVRSFVNDYPWQTLIAAVGLVAIVLLIGLVWLWP